MVLIVVLLVMALLLLAGAAFSHLMLSENQSAQHSGRRLQSRAIAESGVEMAMWYLVQDVEEQRKLGGHFDNAGQFQHQAVVGEAEGTEPGQFTISTPKVDSEGRLDGVRYGLLDESAKINLNAILTADDYQENGARKLLVAVLGDMGRDMGMDDALADKILDFIDADDETRPQGAESDYYSGKGYAPNNSPLKSLEELTLVDGVDWRLVYGRDINRNGKVDPEESTLDGKFYDKEDPRGWSAYLTIYGAEKNLTPDTPPELKIDLNQEDLKTLHEQLTAKLGAAWATYLVAYRQNGAATSDVAGLREQERTGGLDFDKPGRARLTTVLDVVGVKVAATTFVGEPDPVLLKSPFPDPQQDSGGQGIENISRLLDYAAVNVAPVIPGRINIREAPKQIIEALPEALPNLTDDRKEAILTALLATQNSDQEPSATSPERHETWLLTMGVTIDEMKQLLPLVCMRGSVYRADVLGYFEPDASGQNPSPAVRLDVVIDATRPKPRLLFWRDISHLGTKAAMEAVQ